MGRHHPAIDYACNHTCACSHKHICACVPVRMPANGHLFVIDALLLLVPDDLPGTGGRSKVARQGIVVAECYGITVYIVVTECYGIEVTACTLEKHSSNEMLWHSGNIVVTW